jgi:hypothetical protein
LSGDDRRGRARRVGNCGLAGCRLDAAHLEGKPAGRSGVARPDEPNRNPELIAGLAHPTALEQQPQQGQLCGFIVRIDGDQPASRLERGVRIVAAGGDQRGANTLSHASHFLALRNQPTLKARTVRQVATGA